MKKIFLNLYLHIFCILLCLCTFITLLVCYIIFSVVENFIIPNCIILLCILAKIFLLYIVFNAFEKCFPHSAVSKLAKELKCNKSSRKATLLLAFSYDVVMMIWEFLSLYMNEGNIQWWDNIQGYELVTMGGVFMFYIWLFCVWKIKAKLKKKSQLKNLINRMHYIPKYLFYIILNILNVILLLLTVGLSSCFFSVSYSAQKTIIPYCFILLCILVKIFLLYVFFSTFEKFYQHSTISKIAKEMKNNKNSRESALLLAFTYDVVVIILSYVLIFYTNDYPLINFDYFLIYEIFTLGGACIFYVALFEIWKIQTKLKKKLQLNDLSLKLENSND